MSSACSHSSRPRVPGIACRCLIKSRLEFRTPRNPGAPFLGLSLKLSGQKYRKTCPNLPEGFANRVTINPCAGECVGNFVFEPYNDARWGEEAYGGEQGRGDRGRGGGSTSGR